MIGRLGEVGRLLLGRGIPLGALSAVLADLYGDRPAVEDDAPTPGVHGGGLRTYDELEEAVARLAAAHRAAGVSAGDRVLVVIENRVDVLLHAMAIARLGAVPAPVNPRLRPGELAGVAEATDARCGVADAEVEDRIGSEAGLEDITWIATGDDGRRETSLASWLERHPEARFGPPDGGDPSQTALLLATSGTTGAPKAASLTSRGLLASIGRLAGAPVGVRIGPRGGRDLVLAALPLSHVMGFAVLLGALCSGVPILHRERFDPDEVLDLIEQREPNAFIGVPTMYADLERAGAGDRDLRSIQLWGSSADTMPAERARRFQRYGAAFRLRGSPRGTAAFLDIYGMVELSGAAAVRFFPPSPSRAVQVPSVAVVLPGIEVRAVDGGEPVGYGTVGELQFRGAAVLQRYEGRPEAGPDDEGWFSTGDHGRIWPGGVFAFAGRDKDRLKVGGFSVFPAEVEEELDDHPAVAEVALVGIDDERLGERPVALVVPRDDAFDEQEFLDWSREQVAGYRRPTQVLVVKGIPRGNNGKIDREAATRLAVERLGTTK